MPGALELLPNRQYQDNDNNEQWLSIIEKGKRLIPLPKSDPYKEIYRVKATGKEIKEQADRKVWGLIDPDLLDPSFTPSTSTTENLSDGDTEDGDNQNQPWDHYLNELAKAEAFHQQLGLKYHSNTFAFHGFGHDSADKIEMQVESVWLEKNPYPKRGFRGRYLNDKGEKRRAILQQPAGRGDGTVPSSSGAALDESINQKPTPLTVKTKHESAYNNKTTRRFVIQSVLTICQQRYHDKRIKSGEGEHFADDKFNSTSY